AFPDGYVGQSASMEIGFAVAAGVPIFTTRAPDDLTLRQYVRTVPTLSHALHMFSAYSSRGRREGILIDPHASVEKAHCTLERIEAALTRPSSLGDPAPRVYSDLSDVQATLRLPLFMQ